MTAAIVGTIDQKHQRVVDSELVLVLFEPNQTEFLRRFVTIDKTSTPNNHLQKAPHAVHVDIRWSSVQKLVSVTASVFSGQDLRNPQEL